jgi:hypothetical protein
MIRITILITIWIVSTLHSPTSQAADAAADSLTVLPEGWQWDRPVAGHAQLQGEAIKLTTEVGRIWAGEGSKNRIITRQPIGDQARLFAEIELLDAVGKWEQCGLLVYQHDDSFVKLVVEHIDASHYVVMAWEVADRRKVLAKLEIPGARAELSLEVKGTTIRGSWRSDSKQPWNLAAETDLPRAQKRYFAIFSQDADPDRRRHALVRGLRYTTASSQ